MAWPPEIQEAEDRIYQARDALLADVESGQPYNATRRHALLRNLKRAQDEFLDMVARLAQTANKGPSFEPATDDGTCEFQKCPRDAKYHARWPLVPPKRVCENHKQFVEAKHLSYSPYGL